MRTVKKFSFSLTEDAKTRLLHWAQQFEEVIWLDSNNYSQKHETYQAILAVDAFTALKTDFNNAFDNLKEYQAITADWIFGYLTYDLKNDMEKLHSNNFDGLGFPDLYFFQPKKLLLFSKNNVELHYLNMVADEIEEDWESISETLQHSDIFETSNTCKHKIRTTKDSYIQKVEEVLEHIKRGDIYEVNFCQEFYSETLKLVHWKHSFSLMIFQNHPFQFF